MSADWDVHLTIPIPVSIEVQGARSGREAYGNIGPSAFRAALVSAIARMDDEELLALVHGGAREWREAA